MPAFASLIVRAVALVFTIIITALIGNVIADNINGPMAAVNFTMFVAALSWVVCLVGLAACFFTALGSVFIMLPLDVLAVIFTFVDAIVLSARLGAVNCGNWAFHGRSWIAFGALDVEKRCREIQASTVFMWFLWICFCIALAFTIMQSRSGAGTSPRPPRPNMAQVGA